MDNKQAKQIAKQIERIAQNISKIFIGKKEQINVMIIGFISGLHVLIKDVPGVGKTTLAKALSLSSEMSFSRIQFTPDLLPGDIIGMTIWDQSKKEFSFKAGAIMKQFILADEINRGTPRTQSSLLEAMQDESVSVDGKTYELPKPFFVIATQNPSNYLGTFKLPEAELDRFGISFSLGYPTLDEGIDILEKTKIKEELLNLKSVIKPKKIIEIRQKIKEVHVSKEIKLYIIKIAEKTRLNKYIKLGLSTRATQHILQASQAKAVINGRGFVIPEDVVDLCKYVFAHRLILSAEASIENKSAIAVLDKLIRTINVPAGVK